MSRTMSVVLPAPLHPAKPITRMASPRIPRPTRYVVIGDAKREQNSRKCKAARRRGDHIWRHRQNAFREIKIARRSRACAGGETGLWEPDMTDAADIFAAFRCEVAPQ